MSTAETIDYKQVLDLVRSWPPLQRLTLLHDVLKTLAPVDSPGQDSHQTLTHARGLLATKQAAPSDEEIGQWLDERRDQRYGV